MQKTVLVTGATGMVGRALCARLEQEGHTVRGLSRSSGDFRWNVETGELDAGALEGVDCVVHLAGESVAQRWTPEVKQRIRDSRVDSTRLLVERILEGGLRPDFIAASGVSYYGNHVDGVVDESGEPGRGFLADVSADWEAAAAPLTEAGLRTAFLRIGVVLSPEGGALKKMLAGFKSGLAGRIGSGKQQMSWIALSDLVEIFMAAIMRDDLDGPINAVAPHVVTNAVFTRSLGQALKRPTVLPVPAFVVRGLFGEMADETVLSNLEVRPQRLIDAGFIWNSPTLELAFAEAFGDPVKT